jgi:hypothetical protein
MRRSLAPICSILALAILLIAPATSSAYDSGPHADATVDAMLDEGFTQTGAGVARINNWFVDMYGNASDYPYSGHADWYKVLLGGAVLNSEDWSDAVVNSAYKSHFDSSVPASNTTAGIEYEWQRLRTNVFNMVQKAKLHKNPIELLTIIGMSLHTLQDFYSHTNWSEPFGTGIFDAPGWDTKNEGLTPTFWDVMPAVRSAARLYAGGAKHADGTKDIEREHGYWKQDPAKSMAKDDPGRPNYDHAYMATTFATRQWIQAIRGWLNDPVLWAAAQKFSQFKSQMDYDKTGSIWMSAYAGHLYGAGEVFKPGNSAKRGAAGSLISLRGVTQNYFEDRGRTIFRKTFERLLPAFDDRPAIVKTDAQAPVPSSRTMQSQERFVRLQVTKMKGIDLGDIGPDDADMFATATIAGQRYVSTVIHSHDNFNFSSPYTPYTFTKSITKGQTFSEPIRDIQVRIKTSTSRWSGTDDSMYLRTSGDTRFELDKKLYNDFENGDDDTYSVPIDSVTRTGFSLSDIKYLQIEKASDGAAGGYKLGGVTITINGREVVNQPKIEKWLEDNKRTWRAPYTYATGTGFAAPFWIDIWDDDPRIYGSDDHGDLNLYDARDAISDGYVPGSIVPDTTVTGGGKLSGRLNKGGDKARITYRLSTLETKLPTPPVPPNPPDLTITEVNASQVTVKNIGTGAAGPFIVKVGASLYIPFGGLAAGAAQTYVYGAGCGGGTATADPDNLVGESNEANNSLTTEVIC